MGLLIWLALGLAVGALAAYGLADTYKGDTASTVALALVGAAIGGFVGNVLVDGSFGGNPAGITGAVVGTIVTLAIYRAADTTT